MDHKGAAPDDGEIMTFALGMFAILISTMFVATITSSLVTATREAEVEAENRRRRVF